MKQTCKIIFYAINGTGLGHLSRLWAIAKQVKILAESIDLPTEIVFLTTSDADFVVKDFPVWKLPSKTLMQGSVNQYAAKAKMVISNLLANIHPNILVLDTQAEGAFSEFFFVKDFAEIKVFIDRKKDEKFAEGAVQQSHLPLYQLILVPDNETEASSYPIAEDLLLRRKFVGEIHRFEPQNALNSAEVRAYFSVPTHLTLIYVSAGGGGDKQAELQIETIINALDPQKYFILVGYGALYNGKMIYKPNIIPLTEAESWRYFSGIDFAICAAGYNTFQELLAAKVPSMFFAQNKGMDKQHERMNEGKKKGLNACIENIFDENLRVQITDFIENAYNIKQNLEKRPFHNGAYQAAFLLLLSYLLQKNESKSKLNLAFSILKLSYFDVKNLKFIVSFIEIFSQYHFQNVEKANFYEQLEKQTFWQNSPIHELTLLLKQFEKLIEKNSVNEQKWLFMCEKYFSDKKNKLTILEKISEISLILTHFEKISPTFHDLVLEIISVKFPKNDFRHCLLIFLDILTTDNYLSKNNLLGTFFDTSENIDAQFLNKILHGN